MLSWQVQKMTGIGGRAVQQDSAVVLKRLSPDGECALLAAVCDGIGGLEAGEQASAFACEALSRFFSDRLDAVWEDPVSAMAESVMQISFDLERIGRPCGTTLTAFFALGSRGFICHLGDSRAYLLRGGKAARLTRDHKGMAHDGRMLLAAACASIPIAGRRITPPDIVGFDLHPGDGILLMSDGVYTGCTEPLLFSYPDETLLSSLFSVAIACGQTDNRTAVFCRAQEEDGLPL